MKLNAKSFWRGEESRRNWLLASMWFLITVVGLVFAINAYKRYQNIQLPGERDLPKEIETSEIFIRDRNSITLPKISDQSPQQHSRKRLLLVAKPQQPLLLGRQSHANWGKFGQDSDYQSADKSPVLHPATHKMWEGVFWSGIQAVPGDLSAQMAQRFLSGSGKMWKHTPGSQLSQLVAADPDFQNLVDEVGKAFFQQVRQQLRSGKLNLREVRIDLDKYQLHFDFPGIAADVNSQILWGTIGGTQGMRLYLESWQVQVVRTKQYRQVVLVATIRFEIYDDFGAGKADKVAVWQNPFQLPLYAMWQLQHRGRQAKPFTNKIIIRQRMGGRIVYR